MCYYVLRAVDSSVGEPVKRIGESIAANSLSDEDIESLVQQLIQKREENSEWQGVSGIVGGKAGGGGSIYLFLFVSY